MLTDWPDARILRFYDDVTNCGFALAPKQHRVIARSCFVAGTEVAGPGRVLKIEEIEPGDYVLAAEGVAGGPPDGDQDDAREPPRDLAREDVGTSPMILPRALDGASWRSVHADVAAPEGNATERMSPVRKEAAVSGVEAR